MEKNERSMGLGGRGDGEGELQGAKNLSEMLT